MLARALAQGVLTKDGSVALCFEPRHGLQIEPNGRGACTQAVQGSSRQLLAKYDDPKSDPFFSS